MTTPSPPQLASPGQPYLLQFAAYSFEGGALVDPLSVVCDITYGGYVQLVPDVAGGGPFTYTGASVAAPGVLWRTGVGQYSSPVECARYGDAGRVHGELDVAVRA